MKEKQRNINQFLYEFINLHYFIILKEKKVGYFQFSCCNTLQAIYPVGLKRELFCICLCSTAMLARAAKLCCLTLSTVGMKYFSGFTFPWELNEIFQQVYLSMRFIREEWNLPVSLLFHDIHENWMNPSSGFPFH